MRVVLDDVSYDVEKKTRRVWIYFGDGTKIDRPATIFKGENGQGIFCGIRNGAINVLAIDFDAQDVDLFKGIEGIAVEPPIPRKICTRCHINYQEHQDICLKCLAELREIERTR